ncbi:hypothetical protein ONZ45_g5357 [Pleurotus djamor]|nr:hypothetical protein ONZ45_g5357 [Pleurotus djamor]
MRSATLSLFVFVAILNGTKNPVLASAVANIGVVEMKEDTYNGGPHSSSRASRRADQPQNETIHCTDALVSPSLLLSDEQISEIPAAVTEEAKNHLQCCRTSSDSKPLACVSTGKPQTETSEVTVGTKTVAVAVEKDGKIVIPTEEKPFIVSPP